jgi:hypothetical protein
MTAETTSKSKIGLIGGVIRGPPPGSCQAPLMERIRVAYRAIRYGCPYMWTISPCGTCGKRPVKSADISYGNEPSLESAIAKGLTTPAEIEKFRRLITGET